MEENALTFIHKYENFNIEITKIKDIYLNTYFK